MEGTLKAASRPVAKDGTIGMFTPAWARHRVWRDSILIGATLSLSVSMPLKIRRQDICLTIPPYGCMMILMIAVQIISELLFFCSDLYIHMCYFAQTLHSYACSFQQLGSRNLSKEQWTDCGWNV